MKLPSFTISNETAMLDFGERLAHVCSASLIIYLKGELGVGKTTLVRGFLHGLHYSGLVKSPTYTLVEVYDLGKIAICHFDLYRLKAPEELEYIGIADYFNEKSICLIEWPERGQPFIPAADLIFEITIVPTGRKITVKDFSKTGKEVIKLLNTKQNY